MRLMKYEVMYDLHTIQLLLLYYKHFVSLLLYPFFLFMWQVDSTFQKSTGDIRNFKKYFKWESKS